MASINLPRLHGVIVNRSGFLTNHWYTIRRIGEVFYDLDSRKPHPVPFASTSEVPRSDGESSGAEPSRTVLTDGSPVRPWVARAIQLVAALKDLQVTHRTHILLVTEQPCTLDDVVLSDVATLAAPSAPT